MTTVIVTHDNADIIEPCLAAVAAACSRHVQEIIVVDNGSRDGTPDLVRRVAPEVKLIALSANRGFAAANNIGRGRGGGRFVALINSDCFPDPGSIDLLLGALQGRPAAGLAGGSLRHADGRRQSSAGQLPTIVSELWLALGLHRFPPTAPLGIGNLHAAGLYERPRRVGWVSGAFCLARREIGPMPELGFMYGEDIEWAAQAAEGGFEVWLEPAARALHLGGASAAKSGSGFMEARRVEALIRWFGRRGRGHVVLIRIVMFLHALLRLAASFALQPFRPRFASDSRVRFQVMLRAVLKPRLRRP